MQIIERMQDIIETADSILTVNICMRAPKKT